MDTPSKVQAKRNTSQPSPSKPGPKQGPDANNRARAERLDLGLDGGSAVHTMQSSLSLLSGSSNFEPGPFSVWGGDGDDMLMELTTDVYDGNVDEEVFVGSPAP